MNTAVTAFSTFGGLIIALLSLLLVWRTQRSLNRRLESFQGLGETANQIIPAMKEKFQKYDAIADSIGGLLRYEVDEKGNPMLDQRLVTIMDHVGSTFAKSFKMSILGSLSGTARLEKGLKGAMASDAIDNKMPLLNMVGQIFGFNTKEYLAEHPEAIGQLMQIAKPFLTRGPAQGASNNPGPVWKQIT